MPERLANVAGFTLARLGAAGMLIIALADLPYSYYMLMRFVVCVVGGYGAFLASERQQQRWMWAFGVTALLFNPFVPLRLDRATWAVLDVAASLLILASLSNRALVRETIGERPAPSVVSETSVTSSSVVTESNTSSPRESSEQVEAAAQRETERRRQAEENDKLTKWQSRVYKK